MVIGRWMNWQFLIPSGRVADFDAKCGVRFYVLIPMYMYTRWHGRINK